LTLAEVAVEVKVTVRVARLHATPPFWESPTVPANPLTAVTRTVEVPEDPAFTINPTGLAAIVKSWILIVKIAE